MRLPLVRGLFFGVRGGGGGLGGLLGYEGLEAEADGRLDGGDVGVEVIPFRDGEGGGRGGGEVGPEGFQRPSEAFFLLRDRCDSLLDPGGSHRSAAVDGGEGRSRETPKEEEDDGKREALRERCKIRKNNGSPLVII